MQPLLNCSELSAIGKRKLQFRLWISKPVTWMWYQTRKGRNLFFFGWSVHVYVPAFLLPKRRLQLNYRLNGIWLCDDLFFRRASEATPPGMGAGTEKRHSDRPAENNRRYAAERVSHTVASRKAVLTVSADIGRLLRFHFRDTLKPVKENKERTDVMNEAKNKSKYC